MIIRRVVSTEIGLLQDISRNTFTETFAAENSPEHMKRYLTASFSTEQLTEELNNPCSEFYFILQDNRIAGYLKLNSGPAQTEIREDNALEIERIYVLKEFQGHYLGQALFEKALHTARQKGVRYIWLGVWEKNEKAIRFYQKQGFTVFDKHIFQLGDEAQTDIMMRLFLEEGG